MPAKIPDITGWKLSEHNIKDSRWTVIEKDLIRSGPGGSYWKCIC